MGLAVLPKLSVNLNPEVQQKNLSVHFSLPQTTPQMIEQGVTSVLENTFSQLSELENIESVSRHSRGMIILKFQKNTDLQFKKFELSGLIKQIYPSLPSECSYPQISENTSSNRQKTRPVLLYSINAPFLSDKIQEIATQKIKQPLSLLADIDKIEVLGANNWQIKVALDLKKMQSYDIEKAQILAKIKELQTVHYLGLSPSTQNQNHTENYKIQADSLDIRVLENLVISDKNIRLKEVANIYLEETKKQQYFRINGLNSVSLAVYAQEGSNQILLVENIKQTLNKIKTALPANFQVFEEYDDTAFLRKELQKIYQRTGISVLILLLLVLLVKWNFRYLLVLLGSLFVNLCLSLLLLYALDISIHLYTLAGFTISFGLVLDNMIVMLEHWQKHRNYSIFLALLGASLTSIASLMLILFLPEEERMNLTEFAQIIALSLSVSLITAFFFTPACYELIKSSKPLSFQKLQRFVGLKISFWKVWEKIIAFFAKYRVVFNLSLILFFGIPVFLLPKKIEGWEWYNQTLGNETYLENIRPHIDTWLGGTLRWFVQDVFESSGYRNPKKNLLYVSAEMPFGTTLEEMDEIIRNVEKYVSTFKGIDKFVSKVYSGRNANIEISFQEKYEKSALPYQLKTRLIAQSLEWGGVSWNIYGLGKGFSNKSGGQIESFRLEMQGYHFKNLEKQAQRIAQKLLAHKRIQEVEIDAQVNFSDKQAQEYQFALNKSKLAQNFMNSSGLMQQLYLQSPSLSPDSYLWYQQKQLPLVLENQEAMNFNPYALVNHRQNVKNTNFKLKYLGSLNFEEVSSAIYKQNRQYIRMLSFEYYGSRRFGEKYLKEVLESTTLPLGYQAQLKNQYNTQEQAQRQYGLLGILLLSIFLITTILFESFRKPLLIMFNIPIAFIGVFMIFSVLDFFFDQGGYAAFVLLVGLLANSSIFILNEFDNLSQNIPHNQRVIQALENKSFAILMTIISSALGLVPFLLEGDAEVFWFSLALGSIAGLLFSILAVFLVLPIWMWKTK